MTRLNDISQQIREDIATGRLPLGSRLTIDDLAGRYGASHMPIREALRQLRGEGLVELEPNRGARVRSADRNFVENLFSIRAAVEVLLARQAASRCSPELLAKLHAIEADREQCVTKADYAAALVANRRFHQAINAAAGNPQAVAIVDQYWVLIVAMWHQHGYAPERFAGVSSDHRNLLSALHQRDPEAAAVLIGAHVIKSKYELLGLMDSAQHSGIRRAKVA
ncbi:MAG TPA: GntR family transcriptional regulator [Stellaceae bacterium]|nr:GntR family transcriptional regulator [Stellaceae bacterium]